MDLKRHVKWSLFGGITAKLLGISTTLILVKNFSQSTYGEWAYVKSIVMALSVFTTAGLTHFINWKIKKRQSIRTQSLLVIPLSLTSVLVLCYFLSKTFLDFSFNIDSLTLIYGAFPLIAYSVFVMRQSVLAGSENFKSRAFAEISVAVLFLLLVTISFLSDNLDNILEYLIFGFCFSYVVGSVVGLVSERKERRLFQKIKDLIGSDKSEYGYILLNEIAYAISTLIIASVLARVSFESFAEYSLSQQFYLIIIYLPTNIYPILLNYFKAGNEIPRIKKSIVLALLVMSIAITFLFGLIADIYLGYDNLTLYLLFMLLLGGFNILRESKIQFVRANGKNAVILQSELIRHILTISLLSVIKVSVLVVIMVQILGTFSSWLLLERRG